MHTLCCCILVGAVAARVASCFQNTAKASKVAPLLKASYKALSVVVARQTAGAQHRSGLHIAPS